MKPITKARTHRRVLVWSLMGVTGILSFALFYDYFYPQIAGLYGSPHHIIITIVTSAIPTLFIAWAVGVLVTGINAIFVPNIRRQSDLTPVDPNEDCDGPRSFTLARCPRCAYERRGLDINAACPECGEPAPRVHTLPGPGQAMALYGTCRYCGRALRRNARSCTGCGHPVSRPN